MRPLLLALCGTVLGGMGACSGTHEPHYERAIPSAAPHRFPIVDVPNLLGLSIDEMSQHVGPRLPVPTGFVDPVLAPLVQRSQLLDSTVLFRYKGLDMIAAYDYNTRRINDLLLLGSNENELMHRAQLQIGASNYLVLPVFQERKPTHLLGLRVLSTLNQ